MNIVFTLVAALAIGCLVRGRGLAVVAFVAADAFAFAFQTLDVLLNWMAGQGGVGGASAFGDFPTSFPITYDGAEVWSYGAVNLVILLVGIVLVVVTHRWAERRRSRRRAPDVVSADAS